MHGHYTDACFSRELLLVPFKESPRCPALRPRNHSDQHAQSDRFSQIHRNFIDMLRSTIGTIAAALAKAQAQLVNPEKSLVATIRSDEA